MTYFEKLANYLPLLKELNLNEYDLKITSDEHSNNKIQLAENFIIFNLHKLSYKEKETLKKIFLDHFHEDIFYFVEESSIPLLERLYQYNIKEDNKILDFFKNILSPSDWNVLRDSLFLRSEFINQQGNTRQLKADIISRYGERGGVISNMCTAGYFEEVMMPLAKKNVTEFWHYYDIAIDKGIVALFVNNKMGATKLKEDITKKLNSAKTYGLKTIHIHGIGDKNINKIKSYLTEESLDSAGFRQNQIFQNNDLKIFIVELINNN
jgi:hypothetical protein